MTTTQLDRQARIDFALALRQHWARRLYPVLVNQVHECDGPLPVVDTVHSMPVYPWFAWLERASQKLLWRSVTAAVRDTMPPAEPRNGAGELALDPTLRLPDWYTEVDIHIQPGGIWASDEAAMVYELGAKLVMLGDNDDYAFHQLFVDTAIPEQPYRRIVDLGCGFGKSTWPFKKRWPDADVIGIDLAAPVLRLAYRHVNDAGVAIRFHQRDAQSTGLPANSVDLVTATMLIHELPPPVIGHVLAEAARVLAPGGLVRILDFQPTGEPIRDLAMVEHGARNNEPYMPQLFQTDVLQLCASAGLTDATWVAFDERGSGRLPVAEWPQRDEWHFPWAVLEAHKPEATDD